VLLLLNPAVVSVPYFWLITNEVVVISLFLPISVLIGGGAAMLFTWLTSHVPRARFLIQSGYALLLLLAGIWGTGHLKTVINPVTIIARPGDIKALEWVAQQTPPDARFLINTSAWMNQVHRGVDGGWWLLPLTGRWTSTPPVMYTYGTPDYVQATQELNREIASIQPGQEQDLYELVARENITHIYLRDTYTDSEGDQVTPRITPEMFAGHPAFETVYEQDGVTILAVKQ
jgi:hypothetical protein